MRYGCSTPHPSLSPAGEKVKNGLKAPSHFDTNNIQFTRLDTYYMNRCFEKSNDRDKNFHNRG